MGEVTIKYYTIGTGCDALIFGERTYSCVNGSGARVATDNSTIIREDTPVNRMFVGIGTDSPSQNASPELADMIKDL